MKAQEVFEKIRYLKDKNDVPEVLRVLYEKEKYRPFVDALLEIHAYTREPIEVLVSRLKADEVLRQEWSFYFPQGYKEEGLSKFYKETTGFIYDCMANHTRMEQLELIGNLAEICQENGLKRILDYGGGVGSLCILLKKLGFEVSYADLSSETFKFAKWRFERRKLHMPMFYADKCDLDKLNLDCIICLEVLEHVQDPPGLIGRFHDALAPNKILICSAAFQALGHVSHLPENVKYAGGQFFKLMEDKGFKRILKYSHLYPQVFIRQ